MTRGTALPEDLPLEKTADWSALVGRSSDAAWRVTDSAVSRRHAEIRWGGRAFLLRDLGSRHGTWINGEKVASGESVEVRLGDVIGFGSWRCEAVAALSPAAAATIAERPEAQSFSKLASASLPGLAKAKLDSMLEASRGFAQAGTLDEVAAVVVGAVGGLGSGHRALVVRQESDGSIVHIATSSDGAAPTLSRSLIHEAAISDIVEIRHEQSAAAYGASVLDLGIRSGVCAAIRSGGVPLWYLYLDSRSGERDLEPESASYCHAIAQLAGSTVDRIRAADMAERRRMMEIDLYAAREAQKLLFPEPAGIRQGMRYGFETIPGRYVGGDLFDVVPMPDGRVAAYLGDTTGKGAGAGVVMVTAQTHLTALLSQGVTLGSAVEQVNSRLVRASGQSIFVTLFAMIWNPADRTIELCDAGHGHAAWIENGTAALTPRVGGGIPIGLVADGAYGTTVMPAPPGTRVVLFSDGVVEQMNAEGEQFGSPAALACLSQAGTCEQDIKKLIDAVRRHATTVSDQADPSFADDLTVASFSF